ncbi:MAG: S-ribosylhomocysteine lyase [Fournierella sp.]|uniref:S-ribosylhomocysteine lyase n=1 Tax=Allofournierella sp. TaxID=1940256 RepID=UPI002A80F8E9|nr:S-ribosylhomocysteine lyase [Fournierella sp.]MDY4166201.1 S-ribosylhomocysteine lyase [Fournierella sp.]
MKTIASFTVDHDKLEKGMYVSRVDVDVITYDIRMVKPNGGVYLPSPAMHTFEHLFATYVRNSAYSDQIIYVGPMGCRTGFYFLTRDAMSGEQAIALVRECFAFIADFEGKIPGSERKECGNYLEHDLPGAKATAADMCKVLEHWTEPMLQYDYQA